MDTALFIQKVFSPAFLVIGLSQAIHCRVWSDMYAELRKSQFAGLIIPILTLPGGLILIVGHNLWVLDWPLYLTIMGWAMTFKSVLYLLFPKIADQVIARGIEKDPRGFRLAGLVMATFGALLLWRAYSI